MVGKAPRGRRWRRWEATKVRLKTAGYTILLFAIFRAALFLFRTSTAPLDPPPTTIPRLRRAAQWDSVPAVPEPHTAPCKIFIVDPSRDLAPGLNIPQCSIANAWPFDIPGEGVDGLHRTPHWAAQHASGHWIADAISRTAHRTKNINDADLVFVDSHCYAMWYESTWHLARRNTSAAAPPFNPFNEVGTWISQLMVDGVMQMKQFRATAGRRLVLSRPTAGGAPGGLMDTCARLKRSFFIASERAVFCDNDRDRAAHGDSLLVPLVVTTGVDLQASALGALRPTFFFFRGRCPAESAEAAALLPREVKHGASLAGEPSLLGRRQLAAMLAELGTSKASDLSVSCATDPPQEESLRAMQRSIFCAVLPYGSQATRALPAAVLSGCIPVFFGPPWAALPLAGEVNYASIAVFFNLTKSGRELPLSAEEALQPQPPGELEPNAGLEGWIVEVPTFRAALDYLREMPREEVKAMQGALDGERLKFYYPPPTAKTLSPLEAIIMRRMCDYAGRLNATLAAQKAQREQNFDALPKLPKAGKAAAKGLPKRKN